MNGRAKSNGLVYIRRSTSRQEASLPQQLNWAVSKAKELGVVLDANKDELAHMIKNRLSRHGSVFLDDGVTGADLDRPGFRAFCAAAKANKQISHLFVHQTDRFARPEIVTQALNMQVELQYDGICFVFNDRMAQPMLRGTINVGDVVTSLFSLHESGEFLNKLAQRITDTKASLAKGGFWTGGRPPYGFVRILVDRQGNEVQELDEGMYIRKDGFHVRIKPKDPDKIGVWLEILDMYCKKGRGAKWIAAELNRRNIPSPDAGRIRTDAAGRHRVSGRWSHRTVQHLIRNPAIIGVLRYGTKSEGAHRRHGANGARLLEDSDRRPDGKAKAIMNAPDLFIERSAGFDAPADKDLFGECQKLADERGRSQRGIPRCKDPSKYPLAGRVFDLTDGCGHLMYGCTSGKRRLYKCGRYLKSGGADCEHNVVDGDALVEFTVNLIRQSIVRCGGRKALRAELENLAANDAANKPGLDRQRLVSLERELSIAEGELHLIAKNLARASDEKVFTIVHSEFASQERHVQDLKEQIKAWDTSEREATRFDPALEVEKALELFDRMELIATDESARPHLRTLLADLGLQIGLYFCAGVKGTKRNVRILRAGVVTLGGQSLPIKPYGKDYVASTPSGVDQPIVSVNRPDRSNSAEERNPQGGVSFTKVTRGD